MTREELVALRNRLEAYTRETSANPLRVRDCKAQIVAIDRVLKTKPETHAPIPQAHKEGGASKPAEPNRIVESPKSE